MDTIIYGSYYRMDNPLVLKNQTISGSEHVVPAQRDLSVDTYSIGSAGITYYGRDNTITSFFSAFAERATTPLTHEEIAKLDWHVAPGTPVPKDMRGNTRWWPED